MHPATNTRVAQIQCMEHLHIKHSPDPLYERTYIGDFTYHMDEDARKLNDLYRLAQKYRVWPLVFDIWLTFSEYIELDYTDEKDSLKAMKRGLSDKRI